MSNVIIQTNKIYPLQKKIEFNSTEMRGSKEMKIRYEIDTEEIEKDFTVNQIKTYMKEYGISSIEAIAYLYFYNYAHVRLDDFKKNFGSQMFVKHAKVLPQFLKKCEENNVNI